VDALATVIAGPRASFPEPVDNDRSLLAGAGPASPAAARVAVLTGLRGAKPTMRSSRSNAPVMKLKFVWVRTDSMTEPKSSP
jgi:hypothetical protein